jgi:peptidoglycan glycosyltransferase
VNAPIGRLYIVILGLFALLVGFTSYWTVFDADNLHDDINNRRPLIQEQQIPRGKIVSSDGEVIAESKSTGKGPQKVFTRSYPLGDLFGNPVGYNYIDLGRSGIELSENSLLAGEKNEFASIIDQLRNQTPQGADLTLTLDAQAQRVAVQALTQASGPGVGAAAVAIEPGTGAVRVMASTPGFDPNGLDDGNTFSQLANDDTNRPLFNRATQSGYPPGSTMKVVTAAAALDSGELSPDDTINSPASIDISGVALKNDDGVDYGAINMDTALTNSVNTFFAQLGEQLGRETMVKYMERFGFYSDPQLDYPDNQMTQSGPRNSAGDLVTDGFDVGRVAIGQGGAEGQDLVTPIQMAEVAATVANDGKLMKPTFLQEAKDPDGRSIQELDPQEQSTVMSSDAANELTDMMTHVTEEGTAAGLTVQGASFAGKTGTAEINIDDSTNQPWFIGFAPADDPKIAVAVTVERCTGCFGGQVAGPIATQIMESLLDGQ